MGKRSSRKQLGSRKNLLRDFDNLVQQLVEEHDLGGVAVLPFTKSAMEGEPQDARDALCFLAAKLLVECGRKPIAWTLAFQVEGEDVVVSSSFDGRELLLPIIDRLEAHRTELLEAVMLGGGMKPVLTSGFACLLSPGAPTRRETAA
jgi:hypothetical protein